MTMNQKARQLKEQVSKGRKVKASIKDIALLLQCKQNEDFAPMRATKLYQQHGGEYCEYLSLI